MAEFSDQPTHQQKILAKDLFSICLVKGTTPDGQVGYTYVAVPMDKVEAFAIAQAKGNFTPAEFGSILAAGYGEPPEDVRQRMVDDFGFNHEEMLVFPNAQDE